ncbi:MAG: ABC transporter ATP-binding protein [Clostridiales bacterium]|nr:ABC transporter ATP-binding protein [Clostridiales bacterium]
MYTVGNQIVEVIRLHQGLSQKDAKKSALEIMRLVGIHTPEKSFKSYPHEMSGGMRQRIMIAMALVCKPDILIADEPTTALDVTIQAQVLDLMRQLRKSINTAIILITHDLGVVAELADRVIVMYAGQIVEEIMVNELFENCEHPYSKGLLQSIPPMSEDVNRLNTINGVVPASNKMPSGCRFHPRCVECMRICETDSPPEIRINDTHKVRCWLERGV